MTKVINLLGGSGLGKTSCAWHLGGAMKDLRLDVEYVNEYVKKWASLTPPRIPGPHDQLYLAGKQSQAESIHYGKVDYIVTDSPILLSGFYEEYHQKKSIVLPSILLWLEDAKKVSGVEYINFFLKRNKAFDPRRRYEANEEQAVAVDNALRAWLVKLNIPFINVDVPDNERVSFILKQVRGDNI